MPLFLWMLAKMLGGALGKAGGAALGAGKAVGGALGKAGGAISKGLLGEQAPIGGAVEGAVAPKPGLLQNIGGGVKEGLMSRLNEKTGVPDLMFPKGGGGPSAGSVMQFISRRNPAAGAMASRIAGAPGVQEDQQAPDMRPPPMPGPTMRRAMTPAHGAGMDPMTDMRARQFALPPGVRPPVPGFAAGGEMMVEGDPRQGPDSQLVQLLATPGEKIKVEQPKGKQAYRALEIPSAKSLKAGFGAKLGGVLAAALSKDVGAYSRFTGRAEDRNKTRAREQLARDFEAMTSGEGNMASPSQREDYRLKRAAIGGPPADFGPALRSRQIATGEGGTFRRQDELSTGGFGDRSGIDVPTYAPQSQQFTDVYDADTDTFQQTSVERTTGDRTPVGDPRPRFGPRRGQIRPVHVGDAESNLEQLMEFFPDGTQEPIGEPYKRGSGGDPTGTQASDAENKRKRLKRWEDRDDKRIWNLLWLARMKKDPASINELDRLFAALETPFGTFAAGHDREEYDARGEAMGDRLSRIWEEGGAGKYD